MDTNSDVNRRGWVRSATIGGVLVVLAVGLLAMQTPTTFLLGALAGVAGLVLLVYALFKRDADRRALSRR